MLKWGTNEADVTEEKYEKIKRHLLTHPTVNHKILEQVVSAEYEAGYFYRLSDAVGLICVPLFFKFPVIRTLPAVYRVGLSLGLAAIPRWHLHSLGRKMEEKRVLNAFKKYTNYHNGHMRIFA